MKTKPKIPQFELSQAESVFNLASETTADGERLRREAEAKAEARRQQDEKQPSLL